MLFLSYARADVAKVDELFADLTQAKRDPWRDLEVSGGQQWWDEILERVESCDLFIFLLSPDSVRSRPCRAELAYAELLGRPILPVLVRDMALDLAPAPIAETAVVDVTTRSTESTIALLNAIDATPPATRPTSLPVRPPVPLNELAPLADRLAAQTLSLNEQRGLIADLSSAAEVAEHEATVAAFVRQFASRPDLASAVRPDVDRLIAQLAHLSSVEDRPRQRRPMSERDPDSIDRLRSLLTHIRAGRFTPVLGSGLTEPMIGSATRLAQEWSDTFEFPMAEHQRDALPDVAQFITVMTNADTLRSNLGDHLLKVLSDRYPEVAQTPSAGVGEAMKIAWRAQRTPEDPHDVLAELPCPIYITANPWGLLSEALREAGREPVVEICPWRPEVDEWPTSIVDTEPGYTPSVERPLVYHVFGSIEVPDSLVITQDDFDDFLISVAENRQIIPTVVQRVLANSAIMLLGFELEQRDVRVLMRSLIGQEGNQKLSRYTHVAAQLEFDNAVMSPTRAQRYMERYFSKFYQPSIDVFWGSVEEFSADLAELWRATQ